MDRGMRKSLQSVQRFSRHISIVTVTEDSDGVNLSIENLVNLAAVLMFIWNVQMIPNRIRFEIVTMASDIRNRLTLIVTVMEIGLESLSWGVLNV